MKKKAQETALRVVILTVLGVIILSILVVIFSQNMGKTSKFLRFTDYEFCDEIYRQSFRFDLQSQKLFLMYFFGYDTTTTITINIKDSSGTLLSDLQSKVQSMKGKCRKFLLAFPEVERIVKETSSSGTITANYELIYALSLIHI